MALPLAVQVEPVQQPLAFPVGAEARIVYDTGGDPDAVDNIFIDFHTSGGLESAIIGVILDQGFYRPDHPEGAGGPPGDFFGGSAAQVTRDFFESETAIPVVEAIFFWADVASFFWWSSPYPESEADVVVPRTPPVDFFVAAGAPGGDDFFTGLVASTAASEWDAGGEWDGGGAWP